MSTEPPPAQTGYLSPKLHGLATAGGERAVFARTHIFAGELLALWGGEAISGVDLLSKPPDVRRLALQVEEDLYLLTTREGAADWVNHSCTPNAGLRGQVALVAMRAIDPGEQVCYDYAMSDGSHYDVFPCACGARDCRGVVTGDDWRRPELWDRYEGYFSPYLARRIQQLRYSARVVRRRSSAR